MNTGAYRQYVGRLILINTLNAFTYDGGKVSNGNFVHGLDLEAFPMIRALNISAVLGGVSSSGSLISRVATHEFLQDIKSIITGVIKVGLYASASISSTVTLKVNDVSVGTQNVSGTGPFFLTFNLSNVPVNARRIELSVECPNAGGIPIKLGFGLTGGTFASPTGTNGITESLTTGVNVDANGSYLDITI